MGNYTIGSLLEKIKSKKICVFSKSGKMLEKINILKNYDTFIIGAYPYGEIDISVGDKISIFKESLTSWAAASFLTSTLYILNYSLC